MYTLNNIVDLIKGFVTNHKQIKNFYFGQLTDTEPENEIIFPCLFMRLDPNPLSERQDNTKCTLFFLDRIAKDRSNEVEVYSDTKLMAIDFISYFRQTQFNNCLTLDTDILLTPAVDAEDDELAGWELPANIRQFLDLDVCQIPT